jgi:hypothetical protein
MPNPAQNPENHAAGAHFTPCVAGGGLLKTSAAAVKIAFRVGFFPAGSAFEQLRDDSHRGAVFSPPVPENLLRRRI